jgi:hypothetical protein
MKRGGPRADDVQRTGHAAHLADRRRPGRTRPPARRRTAPCCLSARAAQPPARARTSLRLSAAGPPRDAGSRHRRTASKGRRWLEAARQPWAPEQPQLRAGPVRRHFTARCAPARRGCGCARLGPRLRTQHDARLRPREAGRHRGRGVRQCGFARARLAAAARRRRRAARRRRRARAAARRAQPGEHVARRAGAGAPEVLARQGRAPRGGRRRHARVGVGRRQVPARLDLQRRERRGARGGGARRRRDRGARGGRARRQRQQEGRRQRAGGGGGGRGAGAAQRRDEGCRERRR